MTQLPSVVAVIAAYNEADVIGAVVRALSEQGIRIHLIDDGSSDETVAVAEANCVGDLLTVERRPPGRDFEWEAILRRKAELAASLDADWFIHHDADEFRESPWPELSLREAIGRVDQLGYNAIDFHVLQFHPTDDAFSPSEDVRQHLTRYGHAAEWDRLQIKCWKRTSQPVDLATSGGHEARFDGRRVCPVKFVLRHYPLRSEPHARQKVLVDRRPRFMAEERARGWHVQYDNADTERLPNAKPSSLRTFDPIVARFSLLHAPADESEEDSALRHTVEVSLARGIADLRDRARAMEARVVQLRDDLIRLEAERSRQLAQAHAREDAVRRHDADKLQAYVNEQARLQNELRAIRASVSWRLTAPVRWAGGLLPRRASQAAPPASPSTSAPVASLPLERLSPLSASWGLDRGTPIDRIYIERFLAAHQADIHGRVLEVKDAGYTRRFGREVTDSQVIDVDSRNAHATIVADLTDVGPAIEPFDCFILTQTLHIVFDIGGAVRGAARLLRPGGVLLCTIPAVSRVNNEDGGLESGDYWRATQAAVRRLFNDGASWHDLSIQTFGNVSVCSAFLYGLAAEELGAAAFEFDDPWFPLLHAVRVRKAS